MSNKGFLILIAIIVVGAVGFIVLSPTTPYIILFFYTIITLMLLFLYIIIIYHTLLIFYVIISHASLFLACYLREYAYSIPRTLAVFLACHYFSTLLFLTLHYFFARHEFFALLFQHAIISRRRLLCLSFIISWRTLLCLSFIISSTLVFFAEACYA